VNQRDRLDSAVRAKCSRTERSLAAARPMLLAIGIACAVALVTAPIAGATTEACNPAPKTDSSFCVTYGATFSSQHAAAPFATDLSLQNSSTNHSADQSRWLDHGIVDLYSGGAAGAPILTPSAQLPANLLVAGGGPCTSPDFSDCGGGHGTALAVVNGNAFAPDGSTFSGSFGISKAVNVNPPPTGDAVEWMLTVQYCVTIGFQVCSFPPQSIPVEVPASGSGPVDPELHVPLREQVAIPAGAGGGTADISLDVASVHWNGESDQVDGGTTLPQPEVIARMPLRCGIDSATASIFDVAGASLSIGQILAVTGCPTARFSSKPNGFAVDLDGSASTTPIAGRTVKKWIWNFGDGSARTTTVPTVSHTYATYGDHTVKLRVADSAGALSAQMSHVVRGTTTSLNVTKGTTTVHAAGSVSPSHVGKTMTVTLFRQTSGTFHALATNHPVLSASSTYTTAFARPSAGTCKITASFPGDADHLGSRASQTFSC
jgi:PKD repeat protein